MAELIRTVRPEEREDFLRFLERCYGHARGFFEYAQPDRSQPHEDPTRTLLVIEKDGRIVSHVGIFEMDVVVGPARLKCGGIGAVATLPEERGHGYMSRLMQEAVRLMRQWSWPLSVLWGDRQRYSSFGYESAGVLHILRVTRRSLGWEKVQPAAVEERDPRDPAAVDFIRRVHATMEYRVERPRLNLQLLRPQTRIFTGEDGYLLSRREYAGDLASVEVVSPTGREAELILGALNITYGDAAEVELPATGAALGRLVGVMNGSWHVRAQGMMRIVDWPALLTALDPWLAQRAESTGAPRFSIAIGCRWKDDVGWARISWDGEDLSVEKASSGDVVLDAPELARVFFGGPYGNSPALGAFGLLLPVPVHFPSLDHV